MISDKVQKILVILLLVIMGVYLCWMILAGFLNQGVSDFATYYHATTFALAEDWRNPYSNLAPFPPYYYPPPSILLFAPLTWMDRTIAKTVFSSLSVVVMFLSVWLIIKLRGESLSDLQKTICYAIPVFFYPFWFTVDDGQVNAYLLLLITLTYYFYEKNRGVLSGMFLSLAILFKITPALMAVYLLFKKKYKIILVGGLVFIVLTVASEMRLKPGINWMYWRYIVNDVSAQGGPGYRDQSLNSFIMETGIVEYLWENKLRYLSLPSKVDEHVVTNLVNYAIVGVLSLFIFFKSIKEKVTETSTIIYEYSLLTIIAVVGSGLTWYHQYTMLLFPFLIAVIAVMRMIPSKRRVILTFILAVAYVLMAVSLERQINVADRLVDFQRGVMFYGAVLTALVLGYFRYSPSFKERK